MKVIYILVGLTILYAIGLITLLILQPSNPVAIRFITSIGTIFAGLLGLCTGYLMGSSGNGNEKDEGEK